MQLCEYNIKACKFFLASPILHTLLIYLSISFPLLVFSIQMHAYRFVRRFSPLSPKHLLDFRLGWLVGFSISPISMGCYWLLSSIFLYLTHVCFRHVNLVHVASFLWCRPVFLQVLLTGKECGINNFLLFESCRK